jgi:hypothetical protein
MDFKAWWNRCRKNPIQKNRPRGKLAHAAWNAATRWERSSCLEIVRDCDEHEQGNYGEGVTAACQWIEREILAREIPK